MKRRAVALVIALAPITAGCGAQAILLGTDGSYLLTVMDGLAVPGQETEIRARLQGGDLLRSRPGYVISFYRDGELFKAAQTDQDGLASISFTPDRAGDYRFTAQVAAAGLAGEPPRSRELLIASREVDTPIAIVDLDRTVVASGFHTVLIGDPKPMPRSSDVLKRLAKTHTIVYLTHRPDYFGPKSKSWLTEKGYPPGPVLLASVSGFLRGSAQYKSEMLKELRARFDGIEIGIGDKISDALAYHRNGLKSFLIVQFPQGQDPGPFEKMASSLGELPEQVQVVTEWNQIEGVLFAEGSFPPVQTEDRLREMARARRKTIGASPEGQDSARRRE